MELTSIDKMNKMNKIGDINSNVISKNDKTKLWANNVGVLIQNNNYLDFIPKKEHTLAEKLNSVVRFAMYFSVLLMILKNDYKYIYIFLATLGITYFLYNNNKETFQSNISEGINESNESNECDNPTKENPFMNVLLTDNFKEKKEACALDKEVSEEIDDLLKDKLYRSTNNIYNNRIDSRQFYTMPNTAVPNDQGSFAQWLYSTPVSCSEGQSNVFKQTRTCSYNYMPLSEMEKFAEDSSKKVCYSKGTYLRKD